jgi:hypothetical protein
MTHFETFSNPVQPAGTVHGMRLWQISVFTTRIEINATRDSPARVRASLLQKGDADPFGVEQPQQLLPLGEVDGAVNDLRKMLLSPSAEYGQENGLPCRLASRPCLLDAMYRQYLVWRVHEPLTSPIYSPTLVAFRQLRRLPRISSLGFVTS